MLQTTNLLIKPLTETELELYYKSPSELAYSLGFSDVDTSLDDELKQILEEQFLPKLREGASEYLFYTLWLIVLKTTHEVVASICFHSAPQEGLVEIGYATTSCYQGKGYITEAIQAIASWCKQRPDIKTLVAEVEDNNVASMRVLIKSGFKSVERRDELNIFVLAVE